MELYHHGILGMKWGIRRYQNKDGSLTAEGIKRYRTDLKFKSKYDKYSAKQESKDAEKRKQQEIKRVDILMKKDPRKLTDEELAERIRRLDMEKRVSDLEKSVRSSGPSNDDTRNTVNAGKSFLKKTAGDLVSTTTKLAVNYAAKKIMKSIFSDYEPDKDKKSNDGDGSSSQSGESKKKTKKKSGNPYSEVFDDLKDTVNDAFDDSRSQKSSDKKDEKKNSKSESNAFDGTVYGEGTSNYDGWSTRYTYMDVDYRDASSSPSTAYGRDYINDYLFGSSVVVPYDYNRR